MKWLDKKQTIFVFALVLILVMINFMISIFSTIHLLKIPDFVTNSHNIIYELESVDASLHSAENLCKGYVLSGEVQDLDEFTSAQNETMISLDSLKSLIPRTGGPAGRIFQLSLKIEDRLEFLNEVNQIRRYDDFENAWDFLSTNDNATTTEEIYTTIQSMQDDEHKIFYLRDQQARETKDRTIRTFVISGISIFVLLGIVYYQFIAKEQRKRTEKAKREIEKKFQSIIENVSDITILCDRHGVITYAGQSISRVLGFSVEETVGKSIFTIINDTNFVRSARLFLNTIQNPGDRFPVLLKVLNKSGELLDMEGIIVNLLYNLNVRGVVLNLHDVSERVKFEKQVLQSTAEIEDLYNHSPCGYYSLDKDGLFLRINNTMLEWLGYERSEIIRKIRLTDLMVPEDLHIFKTNFPLLIERGYVSDLEFVLTRKDGSRLPVMINATAIRNEKGEFLRTRSTAIDNTGRKKAEEAFRDSENRYRLISEHMQDLVCLHKPDGTYIYVSPSVKDLLGYTPEELLGKDPYNFLHPGDIERVKTTAHQKALGGIRDNLIEYRVRKKSGEYIWFETITEPIKNTKGEVIKLQTTSRDVTLKKLAELELLSSKNELEKFAHEVSVNLQDPLRPTTGFAQLLEKKFKDQTDPKTLEYIQHIISASRQMERLINNLLEYSTVNSNVRRIETVDVGDLIAQIPNMIEPGVTDHSFKIEFGKLPIILAERAKILQLFYNLIENAIKFKRDENALVQITADETNEVWHFQVKDNGLGFSMEYADKIFQVFQRLHPKIEYPGSGVGLAICRKIVERYGGRIWAESIPGEGSVFHFTIPKQG